MLDDKTKVDLLVSLAKTYSPSGCERQVALTLEQFLKEHVDEVFIDDAGNVIAMRGRGPVLMLHAHMDTVPGPLNIRFSEDALVGLGVADDKAPLAAMAVAIAELEHVPCKVVFAGVVEEETTSRGTKFLIEEVERDAVPRPAAIIVGEPTGIDRIVYAYRGSLHVRIVARARGGHASTPICSENPIVTVYEIYKKICDKLNAGTRYDTITAVPTIIRGGEAPNMIPTMCELEIDIRIPPSLSCEWVLKQLQALKEKLTSSVELHVGECTEPIMVDISNIAARAVSRAIIKILRKPPTPAKKWGTSDMNLLAKITRNLIAYGPGEHETLHTYEEVVKISDYLTSIRIYETAIEEFSRLLH